MSQRPSPAERRAPVQGVRVAVTIGVLALLVMIAPWLMAWISPPLAQPQAYHAFADQRVLFGLPHALNVLSNLPFFLLGVAGLLLATGRDDSAFWPYRFFFAGTLLTAFGSAWYHLAPSDATLVWDRVPIALGFAGLTAGVLADRQPALSGALTAALPVSACGAVVYWAASDNLLPYVVMQVVSAGAVVLATAFAPSLYTHARWLYGAVGLYALALAAERFDGAIYAWLAQMISGHTLKHLLAAVGIGIVYAMLRLRRRR